MKYQINTLREGMRVSEIYLCRSRLVAVNKNGKEYLSMTLQDSTGSIDAKMWDVTSPGCGSFEALDYVFVDADVTVFMNTKQLNVRRIRRAEDGEYDPKDYLPVTGKDVEAMYADLLALEESVKDPYLKRLLDIFFKNDAVKRAFCFHSAAKTIHHGFVGGLLEHTLGVTKLCDYLAGAYPALNRDLLITAAMFHDIGKLKEISPFPENDYTDDGQLLGHIYLGTEMVSAQIRGIKDFPHRLAAELKHCLLSHHGELEFGSPKKPALLEALALSYADNTDAKLETMTEALKNGSEQNAAGWMGYNRALETNIRKTTGCQ